MARLNNPKHEEIFQKSGIDIVVSPTKTIISLIEAELPSSRFVPLMTLKSAGLEIIEVRIPAEASVVGKTLGEINLPRSCNLALIIREKQFVSPTANTILLANDEVFALVNREGEEELRRAFGTLE
jgi:trk system potassium uptake protein TrkA